MQDEFSQIDEKDLVKQAGDFDKMKEEVKKKKATNIIDQEF